MIRIKAIFILAVIIVLFAFTSADDLTGSWKTKPSSDGNVTAVVFKPDNSFETYMDMKPFVKGTYSFQDGILLFRDNRCLYVKGMYRIDFFSNSDSLRFEVINDYCVERKEEMARLVLGRVE